jgi:hypothetical protein
MTPIEGQSIMKGHVTADDKNAKKIIVKKIGNLAFNGDLLSLTFDPHCK